MVQEDVKSPYARWSQLLQRSVLNNTQRPSRDAVRKLSDKDVKVLRKLAEEKQPAREISQDKVLAVLTERAPDAETAKVLMNIIDDAERPALLRTVVAIELSRLPSATAEEALLKHVADGDAQVAQRVFQSLGKVGSEKALNELEAMRPPEKPYVRRQWEFGKRLIRHRLGKHSEEPPLLKGTTWNTEGPERPRPLPIEGILPERIKASIEGLRDEVFGTELSEDQGYSVEIDRSLQHLLLAKRLATREGIKLLRQAPMVAAVIAMWQPRTNKPVLDQIVLTEPYEDGVLVQGFRPDGTLLFEGYGTVRGDTASFTIVNVDRPGQCRFRITGELNTEGLVARAETLPRQKPRHTLTLLGAVQ